MKTSIVFEVAIEILLVEMLDDFTARDDPSGVVHQIGQQPVFMAGELNGLAVDGDAAGAGVEPDRADNEIAGCVTGGATQQRAKPREHLLHVERLGDIVVRARVDALNLVAPAIARGQDQHRHRSTGLAPGLQNRNAVPLGKADVEHNCVVRLGVAAEPALLPVERPVDGVARGLQRGRNLAVEISIVFDNQQSHSGPRVLPASVLDRRVVRFMDRRLVRFMRFTRRLVRGSGDQFACARLHFNAREPPVPMEERDLVDEFVAGMAEPGRQGLRLALLGGVSERRERLEQLVRLDLVPGFRRIETERLGRGGVQLRFGGARGYARHREDQGRGAASEGRRGHGDKRPFPERRLTCSQSRLNAM